MTPYLRAIIQGTATFQGFTVLMYIYVYLLFDHLIFSFFRLLRHGQVGKAFKLAVDINDYDLFMDIHHYAKRKSMQDLADAALIKAQSTFANNDDHLDLSHVDVSYHGSSDDEEDDDGDNDEQQPRIE